MEKLLNVLLVDDSQDDVDIILSELRRGGYYNVKSKRVDNEQDMNLSLERQNWDIIICDYSMPHFNAMAALTLLKATGLDIPVIVVSGVVGEEVAVETMRIGAKDYVIKYNFTRLVPAIKRELLQAEMKRQELRREKQVELVFNLCHDFLLIAGFDGYFKVFNPQWSKVLGWSDTELMTKPFLEFVHPEDRYRTVSALKELESGKQVKDFENRYICKDGSYRRFLWNAVAIVHEKLYVASAYDVTDIRQVEEAAERSERRFREILEETHLFSVVLDMDGRVIFCNYALLDKTGFMREEVVGKNWFDVFLPDDARKRVSEMFFTNIKKGEIPSYFENEIKNRRGGSLFVVWNNIILRDNTGQVIGTASIGEDVTDRRKYEKNMAEKIAETEKLNKFMTGRELKIIELKREVDELLKAGGGEPKYKV